MISLVKNIYENNLVIIYAYNLGMTPKLSVVVNAQTVEADLPRCLASVKAMADEIIVLDQGSTDKTADIAKKAGAKVISHDSVKYVDKQFWFLSMGRLDLVLAPKKCAIPCQKNN